ncbi:hypothetical protein Nepgr_008371 [Nepenthes gracilis]|uniref:NAC domain-containing protein n=1 Tax=Nepenthes gracilis TaxID=150966 RepID=A0AAD3S9M0_NEPGR|nr:hypothetical protein Nepgr_008371 [Nepenthes gracilis]
MEACVPPGFRFHPTDEELVGYYLKKKVASQKIDLEVIRHIDLYRIEPWDLQEMCRIGHEEQKEWYFFSHKDRKYPTGSRTNRATMAGFWKATGRDKAVYGKMKVIGMRKTLVFYRGRAPNGQKTDWVMHEYRLESDENGTPQEEGWVVCRAFKKRTSIQSKFIDGWDSSNFYDDVSSDHHCVDPTHPPPPPPPPAPQSFISPSFHLCKQEELLQYSDALNFLCSDDFVQLPLLESPSLPPISDQRFNNNEDNDDGREDHQAVEINKRCNENEMTHDWRTMDKFVASQLSQDGNNSEMALVLLQGGKEDDNENSMLIDGFMVSDSDIGLHMHI